MGYSRTHDLVQENIRKQYCDRHLINKCIIPDVMSNEPRLLQMILKRRVFVVKMMRVDNHTNNHNSKYYIVMATFRPFCGLGIRTPVIFKKSYASSFRSPEAQDYQNPAVTILGFWISFYIFILGFNLASNDSHKITQGLKQHLFIIFVHLALSN